MLKVGKKIIVVALGGNALVQEGEKGTIQEQFANTRKSITGIVQCIKKGFDVVITHGNGNLEIRRTRFPLNRLRE